MFVMMTRICVGGCLRRWFSFVAERVHEMDEER